MRPVLVLSGYVVKLSILASRAIQKSSVFCHFFVQCFAATQLARQLQQECTQVGRSNKEARKRLARRHCSNGPWTHACCFDVCCECRMWNFVLKWSICMVVVDVGIVIICIMTCTLWFKPSCLVLWVSLCCVELFFFNPPLLLFLFVFEVH